MSGWPRQRLAAILVCALAGAPAGAQLSPHQLAAIQAEGEANDWTFQTGANPATELPIEALCGLKEPAGWRQNGTAAVPEPQAAAPAPLPAAFDWRTQAALPPVRNQGGCGACWAFSTVGVLECAIAIKDGRVVDLSEQWLINCNQEGWNCAGGWYAHDYHQARPDRCGQSGAVLENTLPYAAAARTCGCPYSHAYTIDSWAYVDPAVDVPSPEAIKRAIYEHGPVSVGVYAGSTLQAYKSGVFNACATGPINHSVVLVGWDDQQGTGGVWIVRNSWGSGWGETGYMRIAYGCSSIGHAACYVRYAGSDDLNVTPTIGSAFAGRTGGPFWPECGRYRLTNTGPADLDWTASWTQAWLQVIPPVGSLPAGAVAEVFVCTTGQAGDLPAGTYADTVTFANAATGRTRPRDVALRVGQPDHLTELFETDNDLANRSILFEPDGSAGFYRTCCEPITALPCDPAGGTRLLLGDDAFVEVAVAGGKAVHLYGQSYARLFVGSNGYVTFGQGDNSSQETIDGHFDRKRISLLYDDLDPSSGGGTVTWKQLPDRAVVTWLLVPEYETTNQNTFQAEMFFDGRLRLSWLAVAARDGLAGLSRGAGRPAAFQESDLSNRGPCGVRAAADLDADGDVDAVDFGRLQACLTGRNVWLQSIECLDARLDGDGDVDADDLALFEQCASGPGRPADAGCGR